jgi:hypothetical protein
MKTIGYFEEFYIDNKFIGTKKCEEKNRVIGFNGKENFQASNDIILENKKKIKTGINYFTFYYPLNGR